MKHCLEYNDFGSTFQERHAAATTNDTLLSVASFWEYLAGEPAILDARFLSYTFINAFAH